MSRMPVLLDNCYLRITVDGGSGGAHISFELRVFDRYNNSITDLDTSGSPPEVRAGTPPPRPAVRSPVGR
jgi:hypothetical protein